MYNKINKCKVVYVVKQRENVIKKFILKFDADDKSEISVAQKGLTADLHSTKWGKWCWNEKSSFKMRHEHLFCTEGIIYFQCLKVNKRNVTV